MFHQLDGLNAQEAASANVRVFEGDGTPFLRVPGLQSIQSVRVGRANIPLTENRTFPDDSTGQNFTRAEIPLIALEVASDGTPVLLRNQLSNDGIWQAGQPIYVQGEWADEKKSKSKAVEAAPAGSDTASV